MSQTHNVNKFNIEYSLLIVAQIIAANFFRSTSTKLTQRFELSTKINLTEPYMHEYQTLLNSLYSLILHITSKIYHLN